MTRFSVWRRYSCLTPKHRPLTLALGSFSIDTYENLYFPYIEAKSKQSHAGEIRLGVYASGLTGRLRGTWGTVHGVDVDFESKFKPVSTNEHFARAVLSEQVRSTIRTFASIPPEGITVIMLKHSVVAYKLQPILDLDKLVQFVTAERTWQTACWMPVRHSVMDEVDSGIDLFLSAQVEEV